MHFFRGINKHVTDRGVQSLISAKIHIKVIIGFVISNVHTTDNHGKFPLHS